MIPSPSLGPSLLANRASQKIFRPPFKRERLGEGAPLSWSLLPRYQGGKKFDWPCKRSEGGKNFDWPSF